jgi:UDP-glucose 4-epimerase
MMKILVTGGAGYIGSHLCEKLVQDGNEVISLDNYSTGTKKNHVNKVIYIEGETSNINRLVTFTPDVIYHLGEYSRVEQSFDDIEKVWRSNKDGIFSVLQFCRKTKAKLIYAGSSTKFGDGGLGSSQSPYAWSKSSNTELVKNYGDWFGIKYAITYFYNVYGGREISKGKYATLIAIFKEKYLKKEPLPVVSPGNQVRNFTHIKDIISGLALVGEKGLGDNYGIGCSQSYSILEIAKMFSSDIIFLPKRKGNRMSSKLVCEKIKDLGWEENYSIEEYIKKIVLDAKVMLNLKQ